MRLIEEWNDVRFSRSLHFGRFGQMIWFRVNGVHLITLAFEDQPRSSSFKDGFRGLTWSPARQAREEHSQDSHCRGAVG